MFCLAKEMPYSAKELYRLELQWHGKAEPGRGKAKRSVAEKKQRTAVELHSTEILFKNHF